MNKENYLKNLGVDMIDIKTDHEEVLNTLYEICIQHETCSTCPMAVTCFKSGFEKKFSILYELELTRGIINE